MNLIANFHFLRPLWLLALVPLAWVVWMLWQRQVRRNGWQQLIPAHLLSHLMEGEHQTRTRWPATIAAICGVIATLALAGPAWQQINTPVEKSVAPVVVVTDLSSSMLATDIAPNRLTRVKQKLTDIVRQREDGVTALVAYAGSSHVVAPLTDDSATLTNLVQAMDPSIMPVPGRAPEQAISQAIQLLNSGSSQGGTILLVTDSLTPQQSTTINQLMASSGHKLSIMGVGSENGAPIPNANGALLRNRDGSIVMAQLERDILQKTAQANGGSYHDLSLTSADINTLIPSTSTFDSTMRVDRTFDTWHDEGRWLALLLLPLMLAGFRRGLILPLVMVACLVGQPEQAMATVEPGSTASSAPSNKLWQTLWNNAWQTADQQAQALMEAGDNQAAAALYTDERWRAEALDRSGQSAQAAKLFAEQAKQATSPIEKAEALFNAANALARAGELKQAISTYDEALKQVPNMDMATTNRKLVEEMLKQQPPEQNQHQDQNDQQQDQNDQQQDQEQQQQSDGSDGNGNDQQSKQDNASSSNDQSSPDNQQNDASAADDAKPSESQQQDQQNQQQDQSEAEQANDESMGSDGQPEQSDDQGEQQQSPAIADDSNDNNQDGEQTEAWLRRIPNNPGDLLRRKFEQQQRRNAPQDVQPW